MQNSAFLTWGLFMLSSTLIASGVHAETERRTFEVATGEGFVLDADWGEVEVRTWDRAAIDVVVERADKVDLEYDQHNDPAHHGRIDSTGQDIARPTTRGCSEDGRCARDALTEWRSD